MISVVFCIGHSLLISAFLYRSLSIDNSGFLYRLFFIECHPWHVSQVLAPFPCRFFFKDELFVIVFHEEQFHALSPKFLLRVLSCGSVLFALCAQWCSCF
jgi:hypothetical protein